MCVDMNFYKNIFSGFDEKKYGLSATETFCMEVINALYRPTINDLVEFLELSQPNITYKIMRLKKKGYVKKIRSDTDKREFFLEVTDKFRSYYDMRREYISTVLNRCRTMTWFAHRGRNRRAAILQGGHCLKVSAPTCGARQPCSAAGGA